MTAIRALIKAQSEMGKALKNASNKHFKSKYADLSSVVDATFGAFANNGFAILQPCGNDEKGHFVETILLHETGDSFKSKVHLVLSKNDMQGYGSCVTYARRYGLLGMAGIAPEDDDGKVTAKQTQNSFSEGLKDSFIDGIKDSLPKGYSDREYSIALADQICIRLKKYKSVKGLGIGWNSRKKEISNLENDHADLHETVVDAYENRKIEIEAKERMQ